MKLGDSFGDLLLYDLPRDLLDHTWPPLPKLWCPIYYKGQLLCASEMRTDGKNMILDFVFKGEATSEDTARGPEDDDMPA